MGYFIESMNIPLEMMMEYSKVVQYKINIQNQNNRNFKTTFIICNKNYNGLMN